MSLDPGFLASLDQARAALGDWAQMLGDYRAKLEQAGFTREEAVELVKYLQAELVRG